MVPASLEPGKPGFQARRRGIALALGLMLASLAVTAQVPTGPDRQAAEQVRVIAAEARERRARGVPVTQPWRTLDRERLARLLLRPELAAAGGDEVNLLIDQAGAWDLLHFDKPSDVLAAWQRWRPDDPSLSPIAPDAGRVTLWPHPFHADAHYSDEAGAFMALWTCLAPAAWRIRHMSPMVWALEQGSHWDVPNAFDFGVCVDQQSETGEAAWPGRPATPRGQRSAAVLAPKLLNTLRRQRCQGRGPDDCLTLLNALASLGPRDPAVAQTFRELAAEILNAAPLPLPPDPGPGQPRARFGSAGWDSALAARREAMRQVLFIEARLKLWLTLGPGSATAVDARETLQHLLDRTLLLLRLDTMQEAASPQPRLRNDGRVGDPWSAAMALAAVDPPWMQALVELGRRAAAEPGCGLADRFVSHFGGPAPAFWVGYVLDKFAREGHSCGGLQLTTLAESYDRDEPPFRATMQALQPLQSLIGNESQARAHVELLAAVPGNCPRARDPWRVCDWMQDPSLPFQRGVALRRLPLRTADRFTGVLLAPAADEPPPAAQQRRQLLQRVRELRPRALAAVSARLDELQRAGPLVVGKVWTHPRHAQVAVELMLPANPDAGTGTDVPVPAVARSGHLLLVFGQTQAQLVSLAGAWSLDDGATLAAMSDLDGDLRLEVWLATKQGECDGEAEEPAPGRDCAAIRYQLAGEVFGSELSDFVRGHPAPPPR